MARRAPVYIFNTLRSASQSPLDSDADPHLTHAPHAAHAAPLLIMPSRDLFLLAAPPPQKQGPASFFGSLCIHALATAVFWFGLGYNPPVTRVVTEHMSVRQLELHTTDSQNSAHIPYPHPQHNTAARPAQAQSAPPASLPSTQAKKGPQTLIQADLINPITMPPRIPVPRVVIWSPVKTTAKNIVPPLPQKITASDVTPNLTQPNQELNLADVNLAASSLPSVKLQLTPSSTSPIVVHDPDQVQQPPATAAQQAAQPTPAAIISLSDLRMKDGTITLPPVNESAAASAQGASTLAPGKNLSAQAANGPPDSKSTLSGAGHDPQTAAYASTPSTATGPSASSTTDASGSPLTTRITLPRDGHFGAIIVGNDLSQQFPEAASAFGGRMAYTTYIHVGLARSWILQYSLPASAEAAAGGAISHLDAPWPYNIVRPNLDPGAFDADALMIRGFVNQSGRFENLNIVFPAAFSSAQFVLTALQQWQFRPAMQNGQPAKVEILLIIPESPE